MKCFIVFAALVCVCTARPGLLTYTYLQPGAPIGLDGRVVDTPEIAQAKAEHAAAHLNEKLRNVGIVAATPLISLGATNVVSVLPGSPIGLDGRVVDTPQVAIAKAQHAAAHINERIILANEAAKSADVLIATPYIL